MQIFNLQRKYLSTKKREGKKEKGEINSFLEKRKNVCQQQTVTKGNSKGRSKHVYDARRIKCIETDKYKRTQENRFKHR